LITSKDNPRAKRWAKLARDARLRREERRALVEGPHLVAELLQAKLEPECLIVSESGLERAEVQALVAGREPVVLSDAVFKAIAEAGTPPGIAAEIAIPGIKAKGHCVFLEGVQDPGNVGAIIRSAAAFGIGEVVLDAACADPWAPKSLRAGMGGHFRLALRPVAALATALETFDGTLLCAVASGGAPLPEAALEGRLGWIFGGEGRGVSDEAARHAALKVTIPMAGGTESLNVAAAAAICLYEAFSRPGAGS
jgi:TrmH family RNA methyltransferase